MYTRNQRPNDYGTRRPQSIGSPPFDRSGRGYQLPPNYGGVAFAENALFSTPPEKENEAEEIFAENPADISAEISAEAPYEAPAPAKEVFKPTPISSGASHSQSSTPLFGKSFSYEELLIIGMILLMTEKNADIETLLILGFLLF